LTEFYLNRIRRKFNEIIIDSRSNYLTVKLHQAIKTENYLIELNYHELRLKAKKLISLGATLRLAFDKVLIRRNYIEKNRGWS